MGFFLDIYLDPDEIEEEDEEDYEESILEIS